MHPFECQHALLLQGPAGPFFKRLAWELGEKGASVTKINFHPGDAAYFRGGNAIAYRGSFEEWPSYVRSVMKEKTIDAVFLFGDCRPLHRSAIEIANELGVRVWVFEEGYLRPHWITLEEGGVNGNSNMPTDPEYYRRLNLPDLPEPIPVGQSIQYNSLFSTVSALAFTHLGFRFPYYQHHRPLNAWLHTYWHVRSAARKYYFERKERPLRRWLEEDLTDRYFLVPLQVHCDFQLLHSPYGDIFEFIEEVIGMFAKHAPPDAHLVFKHHPMDRAYREYGSYFRERAESSGLQERLIYVHDLHLPTLLRHAIGTITINSTVGLQSVGEDTPTIALGTAVYDMPGLTHQGDLESFLRLPEPIDRHLYEQFRRYLLHTNQLNGNFYKQLTGDPRGIGARFFPGLPEKRSGFRAEEDGDTAPAQ